jgi:hypothetical protein
MQEDERWEPKTLEEALDVIEDLEHQIRLLEDNLREVRNDRDDAEEWLYRKESELDELRAEIAR